MAQEAPRRLRASWKGALNATRRRQRSRQRLHPSDAAPGRRGHDGSPSGLSNRRRSPAAPSIRGPADGPSSQPIFMVGPLARTWRLLPAPAVQTDHYPEPDGPGLADKPKHPRLNAYFSRSQSCLWYDERYIFTYPAVVQGEGGPHRLDPDLAGVVVACRG